MTPHRTRWRAARPALAGAALVLVAGLTGGAAAGTAQPGSVARPIIETGDPLPSPQIATPQRQPGTAAVTLITGDQVRVDTFTDGAQDAELVDTAADTFPAHTVQFTWGGDQYVVPGEAVPYLGGVLDPALFNVSYLVRAELDDAHNRMLPVAITEAGGRAAELPAVRVAGVINGTATAAVAKAEAGALGARLGELWRAGATGSSATPIGQLPGIARISLAAPRNVPPPPQLATGPAGGGTGAQPTATRYRTVTLNPIDRDGKPGVAVGFMHHVDDPRRYALFAIAAGTGPLTFSVPEGTYSIEFSVLNGPVADLRAAGTLVLEPEVAVTSDRTITLDARRAVPYETNVDPAVRPGWRVSRLMVTRVNELRDGINSGVNASLAMKLLASPRFGGHTLYATPTAPVTRGHLELVGYTSFTDTEQGSTTNPRHVFVSLWERAVPSSLSTVVRQADLTTVRSALYHSPSGRTGIVARQEIQFLTPWSRSGLLYGGVVPIGERVDYWHTNQPDKVVWAPVYLTDERTSLWAGRRTIRPGEQIRLTWNKGPLAPSAAAPYSASAVFDSRYGGQPLGTLCAACRQDDNGVFAVSPFADSSPGHYGESELRNSPDRWSFDFYRDGALAMTSRSAHPRAFGQTRLLLPLLPQSADYRLDWAMSRNGDPNAWVRTNWTFRSAATDPAGTLPDGARCGPDPGRGCAFLPLLFARYDLPLDFEGRAPAGGPFELTVHIGHQQHQPAPAGLTAGVSVSFDGGANWTEPVAASHHGNGRFTTTVIHPPLAATDGFVALRVQTRDAAGNALDQTITRAYGLAG